MQKKRIISLVLALIGIVGAAIALNQIVFPVRIAPSSVKCSTHSEEIYFLEGIANRYHSEELTDDEHAISFTGTLPSTNPSDYTAIRCDFDIKNHSFVEQYSVNATLRNAEKYKDNILFSVDANGVMTVPVWRRSDSSASILIEIYSGNLSEAQIQELVNGLEVEVKAYGWYFGTRSKIISYASCEAITME